MLDSKGWVAVVAAFCCLLFVQRSHVRQEKEQEKIEMIQKIELFQKALREKGKLSE